MILTRGESRCRISYTNFTGLIQFGQKTMHPEESKMWRIA